MYGCQQILLHPDSELEAILEFICKTANSLINCGIYYARQIYFKTKKFLGKYDLEAEHKTNKHFKALHSQAAQQVLRSVSESFESFKKLKRAFNRGEITDKPRPPKYRKSGGFALVSYPKQALKLVDNKIRIPLGKQVKCWFGLDCFFIPMPSNLKFADIKELRILPRNRCFYVEFVYKTNVIEVDVDPNNALGIDPGISNWLACTSNVGTSFVIDGRHVKSLNRWYNKQVSTLKENQPQGFWSNRLAAITEKRNRQMRDAINKAASLVINHCIEHRIGTVVFGWNQGQRQEIKLGKTNQSFVQIPTARLKERISQLCQQYGIRFVETEEAYTSAASYLDGDALPKRSEKPEGYKPSGKRVKRGLYRTANNWYVNADVQAAGNMIRKVSRTLGLDLSRLSRGVLTRPQRIKLWSVKQTRSGAYRRPPRSISLESPRLLARGEVNFGLFGIGQLIDLFLIPNMVDDYNAKLRAKMGVSVAGIPLSDPVVATQVIPTNPKEQLMVKLLKAAAVRDGKLSVTQGVMETGASFTQVETTLKEMVRSGYVEVDNHPTSGVVVYKFIEL